jgi:hypothetical protein
MFDSDLQPEFSEKILKITAKIKCTRDPDQLKVLIAGLKALFHRYCASWEFEDLYTGVSEALERGDIESVHLSAETIEDALA